MRVGVVCVVCVACASPNKGPIDGTVHGETFAIADTVSAVVHGGFGPFAAFQMSSVGGLCDDTANAVERAGAQIILVNVAISDGSNLTAPTGPGTYAITTGSGRPAGRDASLGAATLDASCMAIANESAAATAGTVTITAVDGDAFDGTFDVTLDTGEHLTGTLDPEPCPALAVPVGGLTCE